MVEVNTTRVPVGHISRRRSEQQDLQWHTTDHRTLAGRIQVSSGARTEATHSACVFSLRSSGRCRHIRFAGATSAGARHFVRSSTPGQSSFSALVTCSGRLRNDPGHLPAAKPPTSARNHPRTSDQETETCNIISRPSKSSPGRRSPCRRRKYFSSSGSSSRKARPLPSSHLQQRECTTPDSTFITLSQHRIFSTRQCPRAKSCRVKALNPQPRAKPLRNPSRSHSRSHNRRQHGYQKQGRHRPRRHGRNAAIRIFTIQPENT